VRNLSGPATVNVSHAAINATGFRREGRGVAMNESQETCLLDGKPASKGKPVDDGKVHSLYKGCGFLFCIDK